MQRFQTMNTATKKLVGADFIHYCNIKNAANSPILGKFRAQTSEFVALVK